MKISYAIGLIACISISPALAQTPPTTNPPTPTPTPTPTTAALPTLTLGTEPLLPGTSGIVAGTATGSSNTVTTTVPSTGTGTTSTTSTTVPNRIVEVAYQKEGSTKWRKAQLIPASSIPLGGTTTANTVVYSVRLKVSGGRGTRYLFRATDSAGRESDIIGRRFRRRA